MAESANFADRAVEAVARMAGGEPQAVRLVTGGTLKLWMLTEITQVTGEPGEAAALVWADDPDEARHLLRERTGKKARVCTEIEPEKGVAALIGIRAPGEGTR